MPAPTSTRETAMTGRHNNFALAARLAGLLLALLAAGCGTAGHPGLTGTAGQPGGTAAPAVPGLPAPASIPPRHTSTLVDIVDGRDYDPQLNQRADNPAGVAAGFTPDNASVPARAALAYAVYELVPDTSIPAAQLHLAWNTPAPAAGSVWVGLADFAANRWDWQPASPDNNYPVDLAGGSNVGSGGRVLAAVLVTGGAPCSLNRVRITAANMPPSADVNFTPPNQPAPFTMQWDASNKSDDDDGAIVLYEWDFDGDGTYDTADTDGTADFNGTQNGSFLCWVRLTDDEGATTEYPTAWNTGFNREFTSQNLPYDTYFRDALAAPDGGFYVCGYVQNVPASSEYHALLLKYNPDATLAWARAIVSANNDIGTALALRPAGGVYLAGTWNRQSASGAVFLDQFAADGSQVSHRQFSGPNAYGDVLLAADSVSGSLYLSSTYDAGGAVGKQAIFHKLDSDGAWIWSRIWGGNSNDQGRGIALDSDGNVLCGLYTDTPTSVNCGVLKLQPDGSQLGGRIYDETQWDFNLQGLAANPAAGRVTLFGGLTSTLDGGPFIIEINTSDFSTSATGMLHQTGGLGRQFRDGQYDASGALWLTGNGIDQTNQADGLLYTWRGLQDWTMLQSGPYDADNTLGGLTLAPQGGVLVVGYDSTPGGYFYDVSSSIFGSSMMLLNLPYSSAGGADPTMAASSTVVNLQPAAGPAQVGGIVYMYYPDLVP
jgi:hypothetical protein